MILMMEWQCEIDDVLKANADYQNKDAHVSYTPSKHYEHPGPS